MADTKPNIMAVFGMHVQHVTHNIPLTLSMAYLYHQITEKKVHNEKKQGYTYRCIWECELDMKIRENASILLFVDTINIVTPFEPTARTDAFKLCHESLKGESIKYYDCNLALSIYLNK